MSNEMVRAIKRFKKLTTRGVFEDELVAEIVAELTPSVMWAKNGKER